MTENKLECTVELASSRGVGEVITVFKLLHTMETIVEYYICTCKVLRCKCNSFCHSK